MGEDEPGFRRLPGVDSSDVVRFPATGRATSRSDFDLATHGITDHYRLGRLALDLEDLNIPQKCDVRAYESIGYAPLKRHIDEIGIKIYTKAEGVD